MQKHPIREIEHTPAGPERPGLHVVPRHRAREEHHGAGRITYRISRRSTELASSKNPYLRLLHDYAIKLDPKPHRNAFLKPFHKDPAQVPEFCSACHKVHLDVPVNNYRWIRGFNDYDNWQASGVSGQGARSFYYPPKPQQCADCHMPLVPSQDFGNIHGFVHSHRFAAANTAVPTSYGDQDASGRRGEVPEGRGDRRYLRPGAGARGKRGSRRTCGRAAEKRRNFPAPLPWVKNPPRDWPAPE